jgi:hypothetical protein
LGKLIKNRKRKRRRRRNGNGNGRVLLGILLMD